MEKVAIGLVLAGCLGLFASGLGLITGNGRTYTYAIRSDHGNPTGWQRSTSGTSIGEIRCDWDWGVFYDTSKATIVRVDEMGGGIGVYFKILGDDGVTRTKSMSTTNGRNVTDKLDGKVGVGSVRAETTYTERLWGFTAKFICQ